MKTDIERIVIKIHKPKPGKCSYLYAKLNKCHQVAFNRKAPG